MQTVHATAFRYFVGHPPVVLDAGGAQWQAPLPRDRKGGGDAGPTYGDYFTAAVDFLGQDRMSLPCGIAGLEPSQTAALRRIHIHLVKHGALYHPARVTLFVDPGRTIDFVLNVAISQAGHRRLAAEADHLQTLYPVFPDSSVPRVFGRGTGRSASGAILPMFAAQWLDDYHELHLSENASSLPPRWTVWDSDEGPWPLDSKQTVSFFRQAVCILTRYFDPHTLSTIMEWHHAAGDFVVKKQKDDIAVRLITVRRYEPIFKPDGQISALEALLEALAVFFLKTSLWMRLDRYDGVGDLVWAEGDLLEPMWQGFIQGLKEMAAVHDVPQDLLLTGVTRYLTAYRRDDWYDLGSRLVATFPHALPEAGLLRARLAGHIDQLTSVIRAGAQQFQHD